MKEKKVLNAQAKQKMTEFKRILVSWKKELNHQNVTQRGLRVELRS